MNGRAAAFLLGAFFTAATVVLIVSGISLVWPGTLLDRLWDVAYDKYAALLPYRFAVGPGFLALSVFSAIASVGCFLRRDWGRRLAVGIFALNAAGDAGQILIGRVTEGAISVLIAALLVFWLTRPSVRRAFVPVRESPGLPLTRSPRL